MKESNKKGSWGRKLFWILFFLVFGITAVTNLAIDHQFTWFRIVGSSLIFAGMLLDALFFSKNARVIHSVSILFHGAGTNRKYLFFGCADLLATADRLTYRVDLDRIFLD